MIEAFRVRNFKCFSDLRIDRLSRLTVVGGKNGVGKTALLECLFMLFDRLGTLTTVGQYGRRGVRSVPMTPDAVFAPVFGGYNMAEAVEAAALVRGVEEKMTVRYNPTYRSALVRAHAEAQGNGMVLLATETPPRPEPSLDITYQSSSGRDDAAHLVLRTDALELAVDKLVTDLPRAALLSTGPADANEVSSLYGNMDVSGTHGQVLSILRYVEPRLRSLSSVQMGNMAVMHGDIGIGRKLPVAFMSEGLARLLTIAVYLGTSPGGLVLVDEIENGIHHTALAGVWKGLAAAAREFDCQIVATTHSYACIEAAVEGTSGELAEDLSYVRLDRIDGNVAAKPYDRRALETALANGLEIR